MKGWLRWKAVSKQATCGVDGKAFLAASTPAILCGWWSGASGMSALQLRERRVVDQDRLGVIRPPVHDAVAHRCDGGIVARLLEPVEDGAHGGRVIDGGVRRVETELVSFRPRLS